ncbi:uncharacterized protein LOC122500250 isoform X1 [Leptopilina heterotoma]|uniref:uncharacterized protein LOC122500250 isoform X1 n=1 Tax=Leptopilina heterotoma TaxID=63436 RepID=UPI001CA912B1|nr:uncharacterized protein LOC122500250 isoform X1 [Leptopilina heterotoma]
MMYKRKKPSKNAHFCLLLLMYCRTMKFLIFLLVTLAIFFDVGGEEFQIPAEIIHQYLNITKDELYQKCEERNMHCLTVIGLDTVELIEQKNGERLIELLVKRARKNPPLNEELWQKAMDRHCLHDIVLQTMLEIGFGKIFQGCVPELIANNNEILAKTGEEYFKTYCGRIERIAKQRIARMER